MIQQIATTETYLDVEKMIYKLCWDFVKRYPRLDLDECVSAANLKYVEVHRRYDPSRGRFTTFIYWVVTNALRDLAKDKKREDERSQTLPNDRFDMMSPANEFDLESFAKELSDDAAFVVRTSTQLPGNTRVDGWKYMTRLLRKLDWTATRILESFSEIREALQ